MPRSIRFICRALIFVPLTLLTQIGGLAYVFAMLATRRYQYVGSPWWKRVASVIVAMLAIYAIASVFVVPPITASFGRSPAPCNATTAVACLLNRAYLRSSVLELISNLNRAIADRYPGSRVTVLEGSFPFLNGFPLLPHLVHEDGRKVDLAYFYVDAKSGDPIAWGSPSPIGFFHFQQPGPGDVLPCLGRFSLLRWDFGWVQPKEPAWLLDRERTRAMILWLKARPEVVRIFIEPYLAGRLGVGGGKVRFQGCWAARHDDHVHVEIR